jgi:hypothetical protein
VVVVPLKTLERSLHKRCCKAGISSIMWDIRQVDQMAQVVFVQPESAVGTRFNQYLNRLEGLGQLDRIVRLRRNPRIPGGYPTHGYPWVGYIFFPKTQWVIGLPKTQWVTQRVPNPSHVRTGNS